MRTIRLWSSMTWEGSLPTTAGISASSWRDARPSPLAFTRAILRGLQRYPCAIPISSDPTRVGCAGYDSLVLPHDRWGEATLARLHRSEEHTSELQSPCNLVCRLLLEK